MLFIKMIFKVCNIRPESGTATAKNGTLPLKLWRLVTLYEDQVSNVPVCWALLRKLYEVTVWETVWDLIQEFCSHVSYQHRLWRTGLYGLFRFIYSAEFVTRPQRRIFRKVVKLFFFRVATENEFGTYSPGSAQFPVIVVPVLRVTLKLH